MQRDKTFHGHGARGFGGAEEEVLSRSFGFEERSHLATNGGEASAICDRLAQDFRAHFHSEEGERLSALLSF
ncbi:hypothetical protein [Shimia sp. Alg240-R146]|uniref:hypothetical protein n=1 Tax=Shimia sp. Alg240-R146 TaxID=2993449 RepID=UPI0022E7A5C8|nr:hypothetical protein [Shimia sp. Alg240-R146]